MNRAILNARRKLSILFLLLPFGASAQISQPDMLALRGFGGNSFVSQQVIKQTDGGFVLAIGSTVNGSNLDSFCIWNGNKVVFMKYSADGSTFEWSKCYRAHYNDSSLQYLYSTTGSNFVLGGLVYSNFHHKILLRKEDPSGVLLWRRTYGDSAEALIRAMTATTDGGYIIAGDCVYTDNDFPIHYGSWVNEDLAIIRVDSNGNKVWSKVIGGTGIDVVRSVINAPGDGSYVIGTTYSVDNFFTSNHGGGDGYVIRLDKDGNIIWTRCIGGAADDMADYACTDNQGGVIVAGRNKSGYGDRTVFHPFGCPIWIVNIDSNKNIVWDNCYGGGDSTSYCYATAVCKATDGTIWIAGVSSNPGNYVASNYGNDDAWFLHLNNTGSFINARVLGSSQVDRGTMVYPLSNGNVVAGGFYNATDGSFASLPPYEVTPTQHAFLTVFSPWTVAISENTTSGNIEIYPNPASECLNIIVLQKEECSLTITNLAGNKVFSSTVSQKRQIQTTDWEKGVYLVQLVSENGYREIRKIILQ
jgi:hypothetical protein